MNRVTSVLVKMADRKRVLALDLSCWAFGHDTNEQIAEKLTNHWENSLNISNKGAFITELAKWWDRRPCFCSVIREGDKYYKVVPINLDFTKYCFKRAK